MRRNDDEAGKPGENPGKPCRTRRVHVFISHVHQYGKPSLHGFIYGHHIVIVDGEMLEFRVQLDPFETEPDYPVHFGRHVPKTRMQRCEPYEFRMGRLHFGNKVVDRPDLFHDSCGRMHHVFPDIYPAPAFEQVLYCAFTAHFYAIVSSDGTDGFFRVFPREDVGWYVYDTVHLQASLAVYGDRM